MIKTKISPKGKIMGGGVLEDGTPPTTKSLHDWCNGG